MAKNEAVKRVLTYCSWPMVFFLGLTGAYFAFSSEHPIATFLAVYAGAVASLFLLERYIPYETEWLQSDGETVNNIAHTLLTKGLVQLAATAAVLFPMLTAIFLQPLAAMKFDLWPSQLPMVVQVTLALMIAEFGLYWAHRIAHETVFFWRFHALHHSVVRLWVVNTGRFHVADSLFKIALSQIPLYLMGAPLQVLWWLAAVTAFIGILTHCNVDMKTGPLDYVFSTPRLHRWHHSKELPEGNTNYGENLVIFDQLFGSYFNPDRPSSTNIGIKGEIAKGFLPQLFQPFTKEGVRQIIGRNTKEN
ncbi:MULTISPECIES: sterol desaturase family protein [Rhizobium/Agrobacterium group]|uniref:sterol desaturase family protein n=1 Tax=Rhizobium/Agrobacterium group TaxID=227290 RepID=UPI00057084BF|nr:MULTISPECIES: sterol desaturase family protein [Rhizobium/Agrobacterium group]AKC06076.1 sterol desaturase [Agrobacterium tumefaciens]AYM17629.1 sterol desaturase [Agrobacterium tumefaciens]AYM68928.1 sterol desaturase [Agrobacterium tumefaciens]NIB56665.1 sterol desaturase family protein [Agrobacterium tumefaciens]NSY67802.1 sterol desaturase family protein [Agrobacterium tumefaciens]